MQPWGKVSSIPGANTLFEGREIQGETQRGDRDRRDTETDRDGRDTEIKIQIEERHLRETEEGSKTQIKEDPSSRSKEEPGPLRDTMSEGHLTL
jgi:hypothetical protein